MAVSIQMIFRGPRALPTDRGGRLDLITQRDSPSLMLLAPLVFADEPFRMASRVGLPRRYCVNQTFKNFLFLCH